MGTGVVATEGTYQLDEVPPAVHSHVPCTPHIALSWHRDPSIPFLEIDTSARLGKLTPLLKFLGDCCVG